MSSNNSNKRKRAETPTHRRRNRDTDELVPETSEVAEDVTIIDENLSTTLEEPGAVGKASTNSKLNVDITEQTIMSEGNPQESKEMTSKEAAGPKDDGNDHAEEVKTNKAAGPAHKSSSNIDKRLDMPPSRIDSNATLIKSNDRIEKSSNQPATVGQDQTTKNIDSKREARIRGLLEHRKLLLVRIRQCRNVSKKRLELQLSDEPALKTITDEEEIAAHREMTKEATSTARKQSRADSTTEGDRQRSSISLRRGSSVGKRMNAALSSLAPGNTSGATAASAASQVASLEAQGKLPEAPPPIFKATDIVAKAQEALPLATTSRVSSMAIPNQKTTKVAAQPALNVTSGAQIPSFNAAAYTSSIPIGNSTTPVAAVSGTAFRQATDQKQSANYARPPASMGMPPAGNQTQQFQQPPKQPTTPRNTLVASGRSNVTNQKKILANSVASRGFAVPKQMIATNAQSMHASALNRQTKGVVSGKSKNRHQSQQQPVSRTICPEAVALREKRTKIREKLSALYTDRCQRGETHDVTLNKERGQPRASLIQGSTKGPSSARARVASKHLQYQQKRQRRIFCKGPDEALQLPLRRKTHWDSLLEEMRWMATDFIEERKWKHATAKIIIAESFEAARESFSKTPTFNSIISGAASVEQEQRITNDNSVVANIVDTERKDATDESIIQGVAILADQKEKGNTWSFTETTTEDIILCKGIAKSVSAMLSSMVALANTDADASSVNPHPLSLKRLTPVLRQPRQSKNVSVSLQQQNDPDQKNGNEVEKVPIEKKEMIERATKNMNEIQDKLLRNSKSSATKTVEDSHEDPYGIELSTNQIDLVEQVEERWTKCNAGSIIYGPLASGKTVTACSLIWRNRDVGPQLLVCSSASMIRWLHELSRFSEIRLETVGYSENYHEIKQFRTCDVVVCEHSFLAEISEDKMSSFSSIVIDCRHPSGFAGSVSLLKDDENASKTNGRMVDKRKGAPAELTSGSWWEHAAVAATFKSSNRLIVSSTGPKDDLLFLEGLSHRDLLDVLALRIAFIYGAAHFECSQYSLSKSVLAWARHRVKDSKESGSKFQRVRGFLVSLVEPIHCFACGPHSLHSAFSSTTSTIPWEIRKCDLTPSQLRSYGMACNEVRSALSQSIGNNDEGSSADSLLNITKALMLLRRKCTHSDLGATLQKVLKECQRKESIRKNITSYLSETGKFISSSQPDLEVSRLILSGSNKMQTLVSLLCEYGMAVDDRIDYSDSEYKVKKSKPGNLMGKFSKKIVVLACLPEIQILVSVLFNSLGINHELLLRPACPASDANASHINSKIGALAWAHMQLTLSNFNKQSSAGKLQSHNIIISSPVSVAGDHGGLGVEVADLVICLDEDWSGRGELITNSLMSRCVSRQSFRGKPSCRFIRLVSKDTCEDSFLTVRGKKLPQPKSKVTWPWPISHFGFLDVPNVSSEISEDYTTRWHSCEGSRAEMFSFPIRNIIASRDDDLAALLVAPKSLPQHFTSSAKKDLRFLPLANKYDQTREEINILNSLVKEEMLSNPLPVDGNVHVSYISSHMLISIVPPLPVDFPLGFVDSVDLSFAPVRVYLENVRTTVTMKEFGMDSKFFPLGQPSESKPIDLEAQLPDQNATHECFSAPKIVTKPSDLALSLLFYGKRENDESAHKSPDSNRSFPTYQRTNIFAEFFSSTKCGLQHDGNHGAEALIYFPPLFPGLLECSEIAKRSIDTLRESNASVDEFLGAKRADPPFLDLPDSKRPKLGSMSPIDPLSDLLTQQPMTAPFVTEDEATRSDAASVLLDLDDDYGLAGVGAIPLPVDSALRAATNSARTNARRQFSQTNEWTGSFPLCDQEDVEASRRLDLIGGDDSSMILVVSRKRPRSLLGIHVSSNVKHPYGGLPSGSAAWSGSNENASYNITSEIVRAFPQDHGGFVKKSKKVPNPKEDALSSAFDRVVTHDPTNPNRAPGQMTQGSSLPRTKDLFKHRLLASLRQSALGSSIFESESFRVAAIRVKHRVLDRVLRHTWSPGLIYDTGPGLPLSCSKQTSTMAGYRGTFEVDPNLWTSIVKRLKNREAETGGEAVDLSLAQKAALRRSLVAPCRVDFGPFQAGFLASPSGTTAVTPPRSRIGVSLPMGVKITQTVKDQTAVAWSVDDQQKLQQSAARFGMNWMLTARILSGFQDVITCSQNESAKNSPQRAARNCRDHWQRLARSNPALAKEARHAELLQREGFLAGRSKLSKGLDPGRRAVVLLISSEKPTESKKNKVFLLPSNAEEKSLGTSKSATLFRRKFSAFGIAKTKKQNVPITIPGIPAGSPPTVVASHPSHQQSVQSSIAASWTHGRTEMWPLQLLDVADRQKAGSVTPLPTPATSAARQPTGPPRPPPATSSSTTPIAQQANRHLQAPVPQPHNQSSTPYVHPSRSAQPPNANVIQPPLPQQSRSSYPKQQVSAATVPSHPPPNTNNNERGPSGQLPPKP